MLFKFHWLYESLDTHLYRGQMVMNAGPTPTRRWLMAVQFAAVSDSIAWS